MPAGHGPERSGAVTSRRRFLRWGAGTVAGALGLGAAGLAGHEWWPSSSGSMAGQPGAQGPLDLSDPAEDPSSYSLFFSRPDLRPPRVETVRESSSFKFGPGAGLVLMTPKGYAVAAPSQMGLMAVDADGRLRWFLPAQHSPFDLQCQTYRGRPVLTWWEGTVHLGTGAGTVYIVDSKFRSVATISEVDGLKPDLHEVNLTPSGTALLTSFHNVQTDLRPVGGPKNGWAQAPVALEVDVATGQLVHRWDALDHVGVDETYLQFSGGTESNPFDYLHMNSVSLASDGNFLIGARNTWAVYKVDRSTGKVLWRLNGKKSDFDMGSGSHFYWQHHVRAQSSAQLTLFDDGGTPAEEPQSRGIVLHLDEDEMRCQLVKAFTHPARLLAQNQGSMQLLSDGGALVGWGSEPYFSRFSASGELLVDGILPVDVESYRAFAVHVSLEPQEPPALAVGESPTGGVVAYVSWNGSSEVSTWRVLAGRSKQSLNMVATQAWADFETAVTVNNLGPYFQAAALDSNGKELARSAVVHR